MAVVVLLRGVNVGKKRFSPAALAKELSDVDATSIGAAGTLVVRGKATQAALRERILDWLPFECEVIVATAAEVRRAVEAGEEIAVPAGARRFATALARAPAKPKLPIEAPGIRVAAVEGRFALGTRKPVAEAGAYPNEVVEKAFAMPATTRDWPTMEKLAKVLEAKG